MKPTPQSNSKVIVKTRVMRLKDIHVNPKNPRLIKDEQYRRLVKSLREFPAMLEIRELVVDETMTVLGGNMRYRALQEIGATEAPVRIVRGLTDAQKREFIVKDNAAYGEWDWEALANEWDDEPLADWGVDLPDDWAGGGDAGEPVDAEPQLDRAEELRVKWGVESGQLWQLGEHRLLCGDCTDRDAVKRVMGGQVADMVFTDPPYGHNNNDGDLIHNREAALGKPKSKSSIARPIANDGPEANDLVQQFFALASDLLVAGGCCCCCCGGGGGPDPQFARWSLWLDARIPFKMCVVWDKGGLGMGWHYRRNWECVLVAEKPGAKCKWYGGNDVPNVIRDIGKIIPAADQHPTEKPVELPAFFLRLHSQSGETIWEPFCGSGSTLIACEQLGRKCRAIEIEPKYVAVTLQRWADATGKQPELIEVGKSGKAKTTQSGQ